jgi:uncharacterized protein
MILRRVSMGIDEILGTKAEALAEAARRHGARTLYVFGSVARGDATAGSDVDLLAEFSRPVGLFEFVRFKRELEVILGRPVDLTTPEALKPSMREAILREAIRAA